MLEGRVLVASLFAVVLVAGPVQSLTYQDVATEVGLDVQQAGEVHPAGDLSWPAFPEIMGGGVCIADFTGDGFDDVFVPVQRYNPNNPATGRWMEATDPHNRLFANDGDGTFSDITDRANVDSRAMSYGCSAADYDADDDVDLYVTNFGGNELWENTGNGTFTNATHESGTRGANLCGAHRCMSTSSAWADYDGDGDLDLYVANYVDTNFTDRGRGPIGHTSQQNFLFDNDGDGTFTERARPANVVGPITDSEFGSKSLGVVWFDHDRDGLLDLYVANDESTNDLYVNDGDGTFTEKSSAALVEDTRAGMGLTAQDYDQDGYTDLFFTHYEEEENGFYRNWPANDTYDDRSGEDDLSTGFERVGWGTRMHDADRDGDLDIFAVNGHTEHDANYNQSSRLWTQAADEATADRNREWTDVTDTVGLAEIDEKVSRGAAFGDLDYDGDTDVVVGNAANQSWQLLEASDVADDAITVRLSQTGDNPHGIGSRVTVQAGSIEQTQVLRAGSSYLSQNSLALNFGIGNNTMADSVTVTWPDGETTTVMDVEAGDVIRINRSTGDYVRDTIAPVSSVSTNRTAIEGWHAGPVDVTVTATDRGTSTTSGVDRVRSALGDEPLVERSSLSLGTGVHAVRTSAVDAVGNAEPEDATFVRVDPDPPDEPTIRLDGNQGDEGWFTSNVTVNLSATDELSGVDRIEYRTDGEPWKRFEEPAELTEDGVHTVEARAIDVVGHASTIAKTQVQIDRTDPRTRLDKPAPGYVYAGDTIVATLTAGPAYILAGPGEGDFTRGTFTIHAQGGDSLSGLDELRLTLNDQPFLTHRHTSPTQWTWNTAREPAGIYDLELEVEDVAGNVGHVQRSVVLGPLTPAGIQATVDEGPSTSWRSLLSPDLPFWTS